MSQSSSVLRVTKALADLQRLRILLMLQRGELCVCQIVEVLALAPSTVSKHLSVLATAGLVESRKEGRWAYYRLPEEPAGEAAQPVLEWVARSVRDDPTIERDEHVLAEVLRENPEVVARRQRNREEGKA